MPEEAPSPPAGTYALVAEPMYSTDEEGTDSGRPGDFKRVQEAAADREPRPGNAAAPGQRLSDSGPHRRTFRPWPTRTRTETTRLGVVRARTRCPAEEEP
jgi:hypothetical protein